MNTFTKSKSAHRIFARSAVQLAVLCMASGSVAYAQNTNSTNSDVKKDSKIQTVVVSSTGLRGQQRTMVDTPVPIDVLPASELTKAAQATLDKALQYRVPSFNTVQTPVNDATSLLDPYEIRNMGPSRSLILINGKRKNASALVYTQTSPGRGESAADISSIPQDAIKRIEVLRDGASAQYGSDAIAGVVNVILKDNSEGGSFTARTGVTHKGDGKSLGLSLNQGLPLGDQGFINYTIDLSKNGLSSRSDLVSARGETYTFGDYSDAASFDAWMNKNVVPFLTKKPDAGNINGSPDTRTGKFSANTRYSLGEGLNFYANAAYVKKKVDSYANYRTPYWRPTDYGLLTPKGQTYQGYVPGFLGSLDDYNATAGMKFDLAGWSSDVSLTLGGNKQKYTVTNSLNRDIEREYAAAVEAGVSPLPRRSPTRFDAGGVNFDHTVFNADFSKDLGHGVSAYFGTEARKEHYEIVQGDEPSYYKSGADSYAGNSPRDSGTFSRSNWGIYGGAMFDISKAFTLDATARWEKYSDFGSAAVGKLSAKYALSDTFTLRSSVSTGFRAPSLHQIYTSKNQYTFVAGKGIVVSGLASNTSAQAKALGVPQLKAEKSTNFTLGLGFKPTKDTNFTLDYYKIDLKDRIILGNDIKPTGDDNNPIDKVLNAANTVKVSFFTNALDSTTSGFDYVFNHRNVALGDGKMHLSLSGNFTLKNERVGDVRNVPLVAAAKQSVLNATQEALMFTSRPKYKNIFGIDYDIGDFNLSFNNTQFGPTKFRNADMDDNLSLEFSTKIVSDLGLNYNLNKNLTLSFNINNVFNIRPSWDFKALNAQGEALLKDPTKDPVTGMTKRETQWNSVTFDGRYAIVSYDGSHFSQLGRMYNVSLNYRF